MTMKIALVVSLVANVGLGLYMKDLRSWRVLATLRATTAAEEGCKARIAARDEQWRLYVASRPPIEVVVESEDRNLTYEELLALHAQRDFYQEAAAALLRERLGR